MKKILLLLAFCIPFIGFAQDNFRQNIAGKIIVEGSDIQGITIYNANSAKGTFTDKNGEFTIAVALNDLIEVRALEYQNFDIKVNEAILESQKLSIFLIEEINQLEEVVISNTELTGNIKTDVSKVTTFQPKLDAVYFGKRSNEETAFGGTSGQIENLGMDKQGQSLVNGLNVVNIVDQLLLPLFRSEVKDKKAAGVPEVPAEAIKYYLGSTFLVENFDIPEHRVEEFIRYVEEDTAFDFGLLNYGREMEFLEVLSRNSKVFLTPKKD